MRIIFLLELAENHGIDHATAALALSLDEVPLTVYDISEQRLQAHKRVVRNASRHPDLDGESQLLLADEQETEVNDGHKNKKTLRDDKQKPSDDYFTPPPPPKRTLKGPPPKKVRRGLREDFDKEDEDEGVKRLPLDDEEEDEDFVQPLPRR